MQANLYALYCHAPIIVMPRQLLQLTEADAESEGKGDCKLGRLSGMGSGAACFSIGHGLCPVSGRTWGKSALWTNISPYPVPVPAPRLLPASPPSAPPDLKQELVPSSRVPGPELQSVPPPAFVGPDTPSLSTKTEPPPALEATCYWGTPAHQRHEEQPGLMAFPPKLVAEQLTSIDAVSSGAPRPGGRGRLASCCHLPQSCLSLMRTCVVGVQISAPSLTNHLTLSSSSNPCSHGPAADCGARPWEGLTQSSCVH